MDKFIQFESTPHASGSEHLAPLLQAIRARHAVQLGYTKFKDAADTVSHYDLHPYLLKEYRNRWYLIGWDDDKGHIRTFGCDRIASVEMQEDRRFQVQPSFKAHDYFEHALGITVLGDGEPETVVFECDPLLAKYLTSQPLHHSQSIDEEDGTSRVTLEVMPTFELLQWLQAHAGEITLLRPQHIQDAVVQRLESALSRQLSS